MSERVRCSFLTGLGSEVCTGIGSQPSRTNLSSLLKESPSIAFDVLIATATGAMTSLQESKNKEGFLNLPPNLPGGQFWGIVAGDFAITQGCQGDGRQQSIG
jgi:hypothetical protein